MIMARFCIAPRKQRLACQSGRNELARPQVRYEQSHFAEPTSSISVSRFLPLDTSY